MIDKWLKDDHTYMQSQNPLRLGLEGLAALDLVERDVRGRTELGRARHGDGCR